VKRKVILLTTLLVVFFSLIKSFAAINLPRPIVTLPQNEKKIQYQMRFKEGEKYFRGASTDWCWFPLDMISHYKKLVLLEEG